MKKATKLKAFMLSLTMTALLLPMTSFAQQTSDDFFRVDDAFNDNRAVAYALTGNLANDDFGAPLGSGLLILTAVGAGYAIARRKRSFRKGSALVLAALMLLGMTACKKKVAEPIMPSSVRITLNVDGDNGGSKVEVNPPHVSFEKGDKVLVGYNGVYVGTLTHNGSNFSGDIEASVDGTKKLYFYFVGNKQGSISVGDASCTVNISDQSSELPVLSFSESNENYTGEGSYTASLHNQCALVKFTLENPAGSIQVGGMHTEATISFATPSITPTVTTGSVRLYSKSNTEKWAILLPQAAVSGASVTVGGQALTVDVPAITVNAYITSIPQIANSEVSYGNLSQLTADYEAQDGDILYGTLAGNYKITIAPGATVTLNVVTISGTNNSSYSWAGLTCLGDATIILKDGSTNNVKGFYEDYPGIHVPAGNTLTIKGETLGTGSLNASSYPVASGSGAGIGGGENLACGNIEIQGGVITATGSTGAAGIGSGNYGCGTITISGGTITATGGASGAGIGSGFGGGCGNITISGGIVTSTGGDYSAGIGGGKTGSCGNITIESTVTNVTAVRGTAGSYSIGRGDNGTCGTVTIGGVVTGPISTSPYTYPAPVENIVDLSTLADDYTANTGDVLINTLAAKHQISIADGATITLRDASINASNTWQDGNYAGLTCLGDATIILSGTNAVKGFYQDYPGVYVPSGKTLTIQGTGSLTASSNGNGAGIGGGAGLGEDDISCGNIVINGGTITAYGANCAAGIGAGANSTCGSISITNGTVVAHAGDYAAGIGAALASGNHSTCSGVSISGGSVTAYGGAGAAGIGSGLSFTGGNSDPDKYSQCGNISITGGTVVATGGNGTDIYNPFDSQNHHAYGGAGIGTGGTAGSRGYQSNCGSITIGAGVTSVTATKGDDAQNSIGKNHSSTGGTCGTVTIEDGANVTQN